jgi:hypothetical protein
VDFRDRRLRRLKVLDFDLENRPLAYWFDGMTTGEVTAIAWAWDRQRPVYSALMTSPEDQVDMLLEFRDAYDAADIVTGHYIRKHDLPLLNAAYLENGLLPLEPKLAHDTKLDLIRVKDLSASQESLSAMYGLPQPKHHMTQTEWREGNRLTEYGIQQTKKRVESDVRQHRALRVELIQGGALKPPKVWRP